MRSKSIFNIAPETLNRIEIRTVRGKEDESQIMREFVMKSTIVE
jgi:hypothetical protein